MSYQNATRITVNVPEQTLRLWCDDEPVQQWSVSTATNGLGQLSGSECTPEGQHLIRAKIGAGQPLNAVFIGRRPTGEIYSPSLGVAEPNRDWVLTRILWLSGLERGHNRLKNADGQTVDSMQRYIYIHGTPDTEPMGQPQSHGCIRMRNMDIMQLFEQVQAGKNGTIVDILSA